MKTKIGRATEASSRPSYVPRSIKAKLIGPIKPKHLKLSRKPKIVKMPFETFERSTDGIPHALAPPVGRLKRIRPIVSKGEPTVVKKLTKRQKAGILAKEDKHGRNLEKY